MRTRLQEDALFKVQPAFITPNNTQFNLWVTCAAAGRAAQDMAAVKRLLRADDYETDDCIGSALGNMLEHLTVVTDYLLLSGANERESAPQIDVLYFEEETGLALLSVFIGEERSNASFYDAFCLTNEEKALIDEDTIGYAMAYIPQQGTKEAIPAVIIAALAEDSWEDYGYKLPIELKAKILTVGKKALSAM